MTFGMVFLCFSMLLLLPLAARVGKTSTERVGKPSAYDVLQSYNLPVGLLPQNVSGYDLDPTSGQFSDSWSLLWLLLGKILDAFHAQLTRIARWQSHEVGEEGGRKSREGSVMSFFFLVFTCELNEKPLQSIIRLATEIAGLLMLSHSNLAFPYRYTTSHSNLAFPSSQDSPNLVTCLRIITRFTIMGLNFGTHTRKILLGSDLEAFWAEMFWAKLLAIYEVWPMRPMKFSIYMYVVYVEKDEQPLITIVSVKTFWRITRFSGFISSK
ncbi:hypothetical protein OSB04_022774 [Centaurea solstitialis]|uniref:Uncharacterized protein n=1 Tax=Centaurea solstitialis TaxID=347529 RepID=A0AA38VYX9_9ASTR|nr:hypothetical protein OSB04_022774 [Centaurea solstitialis]